MAEVLPASFARRWTIDASQSRRSGVLSWRLRVGLLLALVSLMLAAAGLGILAWWKPIQKPALLVLASAPQGTVSPDRMLAVLGDGQSLTGIARPNTHVLVSESAPTRAELLHYVNMIRLAKRHDYIVLLVSAVAGVSSTNDVVLFTSDAGPANADNALRLSELTDAITQCRAAGILVLLDLVPANAATLAVVPPLDLAARVDATLISANLGSAAIVTSHSPNELSQLVPIGDRTLFGWLCDRALHGAADGQVDGLRDGRVTSVELVSYLQQQLPPMALRTAGASQLPRVYGTTASFDVSVVSRVTPAPSSVTEYPKWLMEAWAAWQSGRNAVDHDTARSWSHSLRTAELIALSSGDEHDIAELRRQLANYAPQANHAPAAGAGLATAIEEYLDGRRDALASAPMAQAKATEQKQLAAFQKAHANATHADLALAIMTVAATKAHASLEEWQALLALADAWAKPPAPDLVPPLRGLYTLRAADAQDTVLAEAARISLQVSLEVDLLADQQRTWPWLHTLLDQLFDNRVHGEALLFASGYANPQSALAALQQAHEAALQLRQASEAIRFIMAERHSDREFLLSHAYLAVQEEGLASAWVQSAQALYRLEKLLAVPAHPMATDAELRTLVRDLSAAAATVSASLVPLRDRLSPAEAANTITACKQGDADAADLMRARLLLESSDLSPEIRRDLWLAYLPLARRLQDGGNALAMPNDIAPSLAAMHARHVAMHDAWQAGLAFVPSPPGNNSADIDLWRDDWRRYRQDQLARVTQSSAPPIWSSATLNILGPFACDDLRPDQPVARFELAWQQLRAETSAPLVSAVSPSDALVVEVDNPTPQQLQPATFRLRLRTSAEHPFPDSGFLAVLTSNGRRYHAPIALPGAKTDKAITILLSNSPTQLNVLERIPLLGGNTSVHVWLENNTSQPQQVTVAWGTSATSPPVPLAGHEVRCALLAPPTTSATLSEVVIRVQDVVTQKILAERTYPFYSPHIGEVIDINSASLRYDPATGAALTVNAALNRSITRPLTINIVPCGPRGLLQVSGGTTRMTLSPVQHTAALNALLPVLPATEPLRCEVFVEGIQEPLVLMGSFPASGDTANLFPLSTPQVTVNGAAIARPDANYALTVNASNSLIHQQIAVSLLSAVDGSVVVARQLPAQAAPVAMLAATVPPGGLLVQPVTTAPEQTFDTSGLVGRFIWRAILLDGDKTMATSEQPVTFDNSAPANCRFVRPASSAVKETVLNMQVAGWEDLSEVVNVQLFIGKPIENKAPPGVRIFPASKSLDDSAVWNGAVTMPKDLGPCEISALITNGVGLTSAVTMSVDVLNELPIAKGTIHGVVLEGSLPQANLEVTLETSPGAVLKSVKTDEQGRFDFIGVAVGKYTVRSVKTSSQRKGLAEVKVEADHTAPATIRLVL